MLDSKGDLRFALWDVILKKQGGRLNILDRTLRIRCSFYEHGQADDFEISLENRDGYFSDPDKFSIGDDIEVYVWFADRPDRQRMGQYSIDDITDEFPPSIVRISGLASDTVKKELRTLETRGFEKTSLFQIVRDIAQRHNLTPEIKGEDVPIERKEQKEEHDLRFVARLAEQYGFVFAVKGDVLSFIKRQVAEQAEALPIRGLIRRRTFRMKNFQTFKKVKVRYYDPQEKIFREVEKEDPAVKNAQIYKHTTRVESLQEAETVADAKLKEHNRKAVEGEIECMGVPELKAGVNVIIEGEGRFDGKWHIEEASHEYDKQQGYKVSMKGYKINGDVINPPDNPPDDPPDDPPMVDKLIIRVDSQSRGVDNQVLFDIEIGLQGDGHGEFTVKGYMQGEDGSKPYPLFVGYSNNNILWRGRLENGQKAAISKTVRFTGVPIHASYYLTVHAIRNNMTVQVFKGNLINVSR